MTAFPDVQAFMPSYSMGSYGTESEDILFRYLWQDNITDQSLSLPLGPITTAEKNQIVDHYSLHGTETSFVIPPGVFCYISGGNFILPPTTKYRYKSNLGIQRISPGWWNCSVLLRTVL